MGVMWTKKGKLVRERKSRCYGEEKVSKVVSRCQALGKELKVILRDKKEGTALTKRRERGKELKMSSER